MRRGRWLCVAALLSVAATGGYRLAYGAARSPVLRTITIGDRVGAFSFDASYSRLYLKTSTNGVQMIDTKTGALLQPDFLTQLLGPPAVDPRSHHLFARSLMDTTLMLDERTGARLRDVNLPDPAVLGYAVDSTHERVYFNYRDSATYSMVDTRTGTVLRNVTGCYTVASAAVSAAYARLFIPCLIGATEMRDARNGRLLKTIATRSLGEDRCRPLSDERTGQILLPNQKALGIVDARTGALVRALPLQVCPIGGIELDPGSGNVLVAPESSPGTALPARQVLVLDGRTGAVRHRWAVLENPSDVRINPLTGHLLVVSIGPVDARGDPFGTGSLSVLDANRSVVLRRVTLGILPKVLVVDAASRHLFVVNYATNLDGSALARSYPDGAWPRLLRGLKSLAGWLPFKAPDAPGPPTTSTVTMLDLAML